MGIKAGDTVEAYGYRWRVLDSHYPGEKGNGFLCLCESTIEYMPFSTNGRNDYSESDIQKYLSKTFAPKLKEQGADFKVAVVHRIAFDGSGWDKFPFLIKGPFLLTTDLYQKYRKYIPHRLTWWWTSTPDNYHSILVQCVRPDGEYVTRNAGAGGGGVVPACIFASLPTQNADNSMEKEIEELKKKITELLESRSEGRKKMSKEECVSNLKAIIEQFMVDAGCCSTEGLSEDGKVIYDTLETALSLIEHPLKLNVVKKQLVIDNYFKADCNIDTTIRQAYEKGFNRCLQKLPV